MKNNSFILRLFLFFALLVIAFSLLFLLSSNHQINQLIERFEMNEKKQQMGQMIKTLNTEVSNLSSEEEKKNLINVIMKLNKQRAELSLFENFLPEIKKSILIQLISFSCFTLFGLSIIYFILIRYLAEPIEKVLEAIKLYPANKKLIKIEDKAPKFLQPILYRYNELAEITQTYEDEKEIKQNLIGWQKQARVFIHEVKNKLSPIYLEIESKLELEKENPFLNGLLEKLHSLEFITQYFKELAQLPQPKLEKIELAHFARTFKKKNYIPERTLSISAEGEIRTDRFYLEQILSNLIINAKEADATHIQLTLNSKKMIIQDNGEGMNESKQKKAFKLGFSTKKTGSGIGLFFVHELCQLLKINLSLHSQKMKGTTFTMEWGNHET